MNVGEYEYDEYYKFKGEYDVRQNFNEYECVWIEEIMSHDLTLLTFPLLIAYLCFKPHLLPAVILPKVRE